MPAVFGVVLLALVVAGCSLEPASDPGEVNLKVESEMWAYQETRTQECMQAAGFDYVARGAPAVSGQFVAQSPYSLTMDQAREHGLGYVEAVVSSIGSLGSTDPNAQIREALDDAEQQEYDRALEGAPSGGAAGCRADAQEEALREYSDDFQTVLGSTDSLLALVKDPRYLAFESDWVACMTDAGYAATGFEDFHRQWVVRASELIAYEEGDVSASRRSIPAPAAEAALAAEIVAAVANVTCLQPLESDFNEFVDDVVG